MRLLSSALRWLWVSGELWPTHAGAMSLPEMSGEFRRRWRATVPFLARPTAIVK